MSKLMDGIIAQAKTRNKHIVLAEGDEPRIIRAAQIADAMGIARMTLIGNRDTILSKIIEGNLGNIEIIDPETSPKTAEYAKLLYNLRKDKGMTEEVAAATAKNRLYFACLMLKSGDADGMVGGAVSATTDVLRPAFQIIKARPGLKTVSSCFFMSLPAGSPYGDKGVFIFGDCGVNPDPNAEQLADIAEACADSARSIAGFNDTRVALLSFSSKGSAAHEDVTKVQNAVSILKQRNVDFIFDGELQVDAAIEPMVAALKAPSSPLQGRANVLVFPDLGAGNIAYKIAQRLGHAEAVGPVCQGLDKPVNDLSRGCSTEDIVGTIAVTVMQVREA